MKHIEPSKIKKKLVVGSEITPSLIFDLLDSSDSERR